MYAPPALALLDFAVCRNELHFMCVKNPSKLNGNASEYTATQ